MLLSIVLDLGVGVLTLGPILGFLNREVSSKPRICAKPGAMDPSFISLMV